MLAEDLHKALADRLTGDVWFSDPGRRVAVAREDQMDLLAEYELAVAKMGIVAVVSTLTVTPGDQGEMVFGVALQVHESPAVNRGRGGSGKTGMATCWKALGLWTWADDRTATESDPRPRWSPDANVWSPLEFRGLRLLEVDGESGRVVWSLECATRCWLAPGLDVVGNQNDAWIGDETGAAMLSTPAGP